LNQNSSNEITHYNSGFATIILGFQPGGSPAGLPTLLPKDWRTWLGELNKINASKRLKRFWSFPCRHSGEKVEGVTTPHRNPD